MEISIEEFEGKIIEVLESLPKKFKDKFENIEIMIDEACGYTDEKIGKDALRIIGMIINRKRKLGINVTDSVKSLRKLKIELKEIYKNEK